MIYVNTYLFTDCLLLITLKTLYNLWQFCNSWRFALCQCIQHISQWHIIQSHLFQGSLHLLSNCIWLRTLFSCRIKKLEQSVSEIWGAYLINHDRIGPVFCAWNGNVLHIKSQNWSNFTAYNCSFCQYLSVFYSRQYCIFLGNYNSITVFALMAYINV